MGRISGYDIGDFDMGGLVETPSESLADITGVVTGVDLGEMAKGSLKGGLTTAALGFAAGAPPTSILGPVAASMMGKASLSPFGQASEGLAEMMGATKGSTAFGNILGKGLQVAFSLAFPQLAIPAHIVNELALSPAMASLFSGFFPEAPVWGQAIKSGPLGMIEGMGLTGESGGLTDAQGNELGSVASLMGEVGLGRGFESGVDLGLPTLEDLGLVDVGDVDGGGGNVGSGGGGGIGGFGIGPGNY